MSNEKPKPRFEAAVREWWRKYLQRDGTNLGPDRQSIAELRRTCNLIELAFTRSFITLLRSVRGLGPLRDERVALLAHVLAHVREDDPHRTVAAALGPETEDGKAAMSESRFRRLLLTRDPNELALRLVRAVKMLGGKANVADLAEAIRWWNDRTRRDWAFRYFKAEAPHDGAAVSPEESAQAQETWP